MKSIKSEVSKSIIINKSEFITMLFPVRSIEEISDILEDKKAKYNDANHHCFAYIIGDNQEIQKYSDDGEPSKTAGLPMIEVLKKHELTNILALTVRYFGGIKLGAGGLTRAYIKGPAQLIEVATFTFKKEFYNISITINFDQIGKVEKYLRDNYQVNDVLYDTGVTYDLTIKSADYENISNYLKEVLSGDVEIVRNNVFNKYV